MAYNLIITSPAAIDVVDAYCYYATLDKQVAEHFLQEIETIYGKLSDHPQYYSNISSKARKGFRDVLIKPFPYVAIFEIKGNDVIVYAIRHTSQKNRRIKRV